MLQGAAAGYLEASVGDVIRVRYVGREGEELEAGWLYGELLVKQRTGATPGDHGWIPIWAVQRMRPPGALCAVLCQTELRVAAEPIPMDSSTPGAAAAATAAVASAESVNATADVRQQQNQKEGEDQASQKKAVERAIRFCKKCGVYEHWQDLTEECCWVQTGQRCVFHTVGED